MSSIDFYDVRTDDTATPLENEIDPKIVYRDGWAVFNSKLDEIAEGVSQLNILADYMRKPIRRDSNERRQCR